MIGKFRIYVFAICLLGLGLSACQKDELYVPVEQTDAGIGLKANTGEDDVIIDPDDPKGEDDDTDIKED